MFDRSLYEAILARKSVRRYAPGIDAVTLERVEETFADLQALAPENKFTVTIEALQSNRDLVTLLGAYGRLAAPPYVIVPAIEGSVHSLTDLAFRSEQIVIRLTRLGLGTCYIGTLSQEDKARELFNLSPNQRIGAVIALGFPTTSLVGKTFNSFVRTMAGATSKLASDRLYYSDMNDDPTAPPPSWAPLIEAARHSPSAVNAQPWRFMGKGNHLYIFTLRHTKRYGNGPGAAFKYYDCGLCMANIYLAMQALEISGSLRFCSEPEEGLPAYPQEYQLLAELVVG
ncbi:MAG: nitroreductase family protein [Anaerolineae bacterium]